MGRLSREQRVKVVEAYYRNGCSSTNAFRELRDFFGQHNRPTISAIVKIVNKFKETGSVADVKTPTRARLRRSDENIAAVRENVAENPDTSIRHRAQELNLSTTTVQRILTKDLLLHAYKIQLTQELKPDDHLKRRTFVDWIREQRQADHAFSQNIIFSDEAHFHLSGFINKQNCRIWAAENPREIVEKPLHAQKVTVWCAMSANGIIGPYFFENDAGNSVTVNGERYRAMITNFLWPALNDMDVEEMWFQQDGATCHTANATMALLNEQFPGRMISRNSEVNWPPRSCDLTPLDFFLWGYLKSKVYANHPTTIQELKDEIIRQIREINNHICRNVIENFDHRVDVCHQSHGGHLADIIFHK
jgi:transposase